MRTAYSLAALFATLALVAGCASLAACVAPPPNPCQGPIIHTDAGPIYTDPGYGCQDDPESDDGASPGEGP
jgi:hypothetical protein